MVIFTKIGLVEDDDEHSKPISKAEAEIQGDILESIFSHVPLIDLVPSSHVSKTWNLAVSSHLLNSNKLNKPWLVIHTQTPRPPYTTTSHAYDPNSHVWIQIHQPSLDFISAVRSSGSNLLYTISPSKLSLSLDPLHLTWHHVIGPRVWRTDPIVAVAGNKIIVAGGASDFEDDPLSIEIYDAVSKKWSTCCSMPNILKDSSASTWISIATNNLNISVSEKYSGVTYCLNLERMMWSGPYNLRPDVDLFYSVIGFCEDRLILVGLIGDLENVLRVKVWEVSLDSFECMEIGEMPVGYFEKLRGESCEFSRIEVCMGGDFVYMYNPLEVGEVFVCEIVKEGGCRWGSVRNVAWDDGSLMKRLVITCCKVGFGYLNKEVRFDRGRFVVNY